MVRLKIAKEIRRIVSNGWLMIAFLMVSRFGKRPKRLMGTVSNSRVPPIDPFPFDYSADFLFSVARNTTAPRVITRLRPSPVVRETLLPLNADYYYSSSNRIAATTEYSNIYRRARAWNYHEGKRFNSVWKKVGIKIVLRAVVEL